MTYTGSIVQEDVAAKILGHTGGILKAPWGHEIRQWLKVLNPKDLPWVVFDDARDMDGCFDHFVHVDNQYDLLERDTTRAFEILAEQGCFPTDASQTLPAFV